MRADFGRNALEAAGRIERRAGAFVHAAAVPNVAAFAFLLVAFHKGVYLVAGGLVKAGKHVPLQVWRALSDKVLVMYFGKVVETGNADEVLTCPQHDYTKKLLASVPVVKRFA